MPHTLDIASCPDRETWSGFYSGKTDPDAFAGSGRAPRPLSACQAVLGALAESTADEDDASRRGTAVAAPPAVPDGYEAEVECRRALARVESLVPAAPGGTDDRPPVPVPERLGRVSRPGN